ncbi:peptidase [Oxalicibacterium flavum]|uniref:Probable periplasmic serine endoprotease DegP-like n=2 Tax=Oxalicibacterium flavum TaxID=179467 RepID=A0A8J2UJJ0_9BURK|nr:peptidase [Oxalicibacterium flavum]
MAVGVTGCAATQRGVLWSVPDFSAMARTYGPAVVNIGVAREASATRPHGFPPQGGTDDGSLGSGFIVSEDGFILTNAHVVARGSQIIVKLTDRREFRAQLIGTDSVADVALLKIEARGLPTVRIGDPERTEVGDWALAIGSPYGFSNSATAGIVSAKRRILPGAEYMPFLQTDVPVNPGNSGGPLFNLNGEVIGINARIYSNSGGYQGLSFAIPIDVAMDIKRQLQTKGMVTRGRIGISVQEVGQALAQSFQLPRPQGALIGYVEKGGAADRAGIRSGDVIMRIGTRDVVQSADALIHIAGLTPGQPAPFLIWRDRTQQVLQVVPDRFDLPSLPARQARSEMPGPLGLVVRPLLVQEQQVLRIDGGLLVQRVSAAVSRAGVKVGDIVLAVNGHPVAGIPALLEEVGNAEGAVALLVQRGSARLFIPIELPQSDGDVAE